MAVILDVMREEKKYRISLMEAYRMIRLLGEVLPADIHNNGTEGYMVRSLYFDSIDNTDFFEKEDGVENRKKIRLRVYSHEDNHAKLELKEKFGRFQRKRSLRVTREQALRMADRQFDFLTSYEGPLAETLYTTLSESVYMPRCLVEYRRAAFTLPTNDIRVTFDMRLEASEAGFDLFSPHPGLYPVSSYDDVTLEVKFNHFLPSYIRDILQNCDRMPSAYSKYCMARKVSYMVL